PRAEDGPGRGHRGIVTADPHSRRGQVARDGGTGLAEAEHRDDQSLIVSGHHARGWSAVTRAFSGTNHDPGAGGSGACGSAGASAAASASSAPSVPPRALAADDCLKYSLMSSRCWDSNWSKCLSTFASPMASAVRYRSLICSSLRAWASSVSCASPGTPSGRAPSGTAASALPGSSKVAERGAPAGSAEETSGSNGPRASGTARGGASALSPVRGRS